MYTHTEGRRSDFILHLCFFLLGQNLHWFIKISGRSHPPRGHIIRLRVTNGHSVCLAYDQRNLRGTSAEKYLCSAFFKKQVCILWCHQSNYVVFSLGHMHPVHFRKQVHILLCHPRNLYCMLKESSGRYPTRTYQHKYILIGVHICNGYRRS